MAFIINDRKNLTPLEEENRQLKEELKKLTAKHKLISQINTVIENRSISDDLYKTLHLYLIELMDKLNYSKDIDVYAIQEYLGNLLSGINVQIFIGEGVYKQLYNGENKDLPPEYNFAELYDLRTSDFDISNLLKEVSDSESQLVEFSDIKIRKIGLQQYKGVAVWVMDPLLNIIPGFVIFLLKDKKFLTLAQKEVITVFMKMVQPVLYGKILTSRLVIEASEAIRLANTDGLTGIFNRLKFNKDYFDNDDTVNYYVGYLDMCRLKQINDTYGHMSADNVIYTLGQELKRVITEKLSGQVYRVGGDEFTFIIPPNVKPQIIKDTIEQFQKDWQKIVFKGEKGEEFVTHIAIGICSNINFTMTKEEVLKTADNLMYICKNDRENYVIQYNF